MEGVLFFLGTDTCQWDVEEVASVITIEFKKLERLGHASGEPFDAMFLSFNGLSYRVGSTCVISNREGKRAEVVINSFEFNHVHVKSYQKRKEKIEND